MAEENDDYDGLNEMTQRQLNKYILFLLRLDHLKINALEKEIHRLKMSL